MELFIRKMLPYNAMNFYSNSVSAGTEFEVALVENIMFSNQIMVTLNYIPNIQNRSDIVV